MTNQTNNQPIERHKILAQRDGLLHTRDKLRLDLAYYEGAIKSLDLLLNPEAEEPGQQPEPAETLPE